MSTDLKQGQYGSINGHVFYDISFEHCRVPIVAEKKHELQSILFNSTDFKFVPKGQIELNEKLFKLYIQTLELTDGKNVLKVAVEIRCGVLYVLEVLRG
jgi:hypothetical protein